MARRLVCPREGMGEVDLFSRWERRQLRRWTAELASCHLQNHHRVGKRRRQVRNLVRPQAQDAWKRVVQQSEQVVRDRGYVDLHSHTRARVG